MNPPVASQEETPAPLNIPAEWFVEGVARGIERGLANNPALIERLADAICVRFELLAPAEAAALLDKTVRTLMDNHIEWGLDKSIAFGIQNPKFFLGQVIARAREKVIKGKQPKNVTPFAASNGTSQPAHKTGT